MLKKSGGHALRSHDEDWYSKVNEVDRSKETCGQTDCRKIMLLGKKKKEDLSKMKMGKSKTETRALGERLKFG